MREPADEQAIPSSRTEKVKLLSNSLHFRERVLAVFRKDFFVLYKVGLIGDPRADTITSPRLKGWEKPINSFLWKPSTIGKS
jgi:hypothetical protein